MYYFLEIEIELRSLYVLLFIKIIVENIFINIFCIYLYVLFLKYVGFLFWRL